MSDLLECRKVLQQDGKRLFCDECGFESFIPDRPPKKERKPTMSEELATLKAENDRLREALELITSADCNCPGACDRCIAVEALEAK